MLSLARRTPDAAASPASAEAKLRLRARQAGFALPATGERAGNRLRSGKFGEWQDKLTRRQVRDIVSTHHQQMQRFGYLSDELKHLIS